MILIPINGGVIDEPGPYVFETTIPVPEFLARQAVGVLDSAISFAGWKAQFMFTEQDTATGRTRIFVRLGNITEQGGSEAKLSPLQINTILGSVALIALGFAVNQIYKALDSPTVTITVYIVLFLVLFFVYTKFVKGK